jgi:hypothetical protein
LKPSTRLDQRTVAGYNTQIRKLSVFIVATDSVTVLRTGTAVLREYCPPVDLRPRSSAFEERLPCFRWPEGRSVPRPVSTACVHRLWPRLCPPPVSTACGHRLCPPPVSTTCGHACDHACGHRLCPPPVATACVHGMCPPPVATPLSTACFHGLVSTACGHACFHGLVSSVCGHRL